MKLMRDVALVLCTLLGACSDNPGQLRVMLAAEETITDGLKAGNGEENTRDYDVNYSKYIAVIGNVALGRSDPKRSITSDGVFIADMRQVGQDGEQIVLFSGLLAGQWNFFGYQTPSASPVVQVLPGVSSSDAQEMIDHQYTYWIEGTVERPNAPVRFQFKVSVPATYSDCETNGQPGVAVSEGGGSSATITLHGDHIFFTSLVRGNEGTVTRRAQWIVDSDLDQDGMVTTEELAKVPAELVFPSAQGYNLSGGPIDVATALDYVRGQLATQGHLDGEGECETVLPQ